MMPINLVNHTESVIVPDAGVFTIRPIRRDDVSRLQAFHSRLSPRSIYLRFLSYHMALSNEEAEHFTSIDYQTRMALVAVQEQDGVEFLRGVARYDVIDIDRPDTAEAAIIVEDLYQQKGLGVLLANRLARYAQAHGIRAFVAEVSAENGGMLRFIERTGLPIEKKLESGVWKIRMKLGDRVY